jgi:hypothetical protein
MSANTNAQMIAESIDLATAAGWNLRALVLWLGSIDESLADYDNSLRHPVDGMCWSNARKAAVLSGLAKRLTSGPLRLTQLGRDVGDWFTVTNPKPEPWWTCGSALFDSRVTSSSDGPRAAECVSTALAEIIAEALNARALSEAKQYRSEP